MRPLVIGQAPGPRSDPRQPLSGASGRRLALLCGLELAAFLAAFERINLLPAHPGKAGKGDDFPLETARHRADSMREIVAARDRVVLLGWNVARAFRVAGQVEGFFEWTRFSRDCGEVAVCPHPSGISHWWNVPDNVAQASVFWRHLAASG